MKVEGVKLSCFMKVQTEGTGGAVRIPSTSKLNGFQTQTQFDALPIFVNFLLCLSREKGKKTMYGMRINRKFISQIQQDEKFVEIIITNNN